MRTVQVAGVSGSGKSTISRLLTALGHRAVSSDSVPGLCGWIDGKGNPVQRPDHPDLAWLTEHQWAWDATHLDNLMAQARASGVSTLYVCGRADNDDQFVDRFDVVVLLDIDQATMVQRLAQPTRGNDFGRAGDSLRALVSTFSSTRSRYLGQGAIAVDATADADTVAASVVRAGEIRTPITP